MRELPADFADTLARVLEPGHQDAVGRVIAAATLLPDDGLTEFLVLFATRVRASGSPVTYEEVQGFLLRAQRDRNAP